MTPRHTQRSFAIACAWAVITCCAMGQGAVATNSTIPPLIPPSLPDAGVSLFRVVGALALVLGIFLGGVWLVRNWQRFAVQRGRIPKLNVVETRSLGGRHALYVVGYEQERYLLSASPTGVTMLTHLPPSDDVVAVAPEKSAPPSLSFAATLAQVLKAK